MSEEKPDTEMIEPRELAIKIARDPNMGLVYSNHIQVSYGQKSEVQIFFGQVVTPPQPFEEAPSEIIVRQDIGIVMTLDEASNLMRLLNLLIPRYQKIARATEERRDRKPQPETATE
jgi:hypothetical protein